MVFIPKRRFKRRPKDVLALALKGLWPGDELICTAQTYQNVKERLDTFAQAWPDRRIAAIVGPVVKLRRVA